jgi:hypothetical protein
MNRDSELVIQEIVTEARRREKRAGRRAIVLTVVPLLLAGTLLTVTAATVAKARGEVRVAADSVGVLQLKLQTANDSISLLDTIKLRLDTLVRLEKAALDSLSKKSAGVTATLAEAQAALETIKRELTASSSGRDTAVHRAVEQAVLDASSSLQEAQTVSKQTTQTLKIIQAEVGYTGTMSPGSPIIATIRLPYRASLKYRRWITRQKSDTLGTFDAGEIHLKLPYGGYMYFEATNLATGQVTTRTGDCTRPCQVSFE